MSEAIFELKAESRKDIGKGASRRLRREKKVPGILYGGDKEATPITLDHNKLIQALDHEAFYSHILTLKVDDKKQKVVLKDLHRHPFKKSIFHVDFQRVSGNYVITMQVPLHFLNEEECPGVKDEGGVMSHHVINVNVKCKAKDLPEYIEVDLGNLHISEAVHLSDLKLPKGVELVELLHENNLTVASVHHPRKEEEEEVAVEEVEEAKAEEQKEGESKET